MKKELYDSLFDSKHGIIKTSELVGSNDRTLIYGYDIERNMFHLYLKYEKFNFIKYNSNKEVISYGYGLSKICAEDCIPDKRVYPEACDYYFCKLLMNKGVKIPFTTFNRNRVEKQFYGLTKDDFDKSVLNMKL